MRYLVLSCLFLFIGFQSFAQNDELLKVIEYELPGKWSGSLSQEHFENTLGTKYSFEIEINVKGKKLSGVTKISVGSNHATIKFKGIRNGLKIEIKEYEIADSSIKKDYSWCIKNMILDFDYYKGQYRLKGDWKGKSPNGDCNPGEVEVFKETIRA